MFKCQHCGFVLLLLVILFGCSGSNPNRGNPSSGKAKKARVFRIAVIPKGTSHDFWKHVEAGARRADREFDDIEIAWKGPLAEGNTSEQIKTFESFMIDGYDAICLAPLDAQALCKPVAQAQAAGIAVLIFDSALRDETGIVSYVASDNYLGGKMGADYLAKLLGGNGNVIMMRYELNSESTEQREQGFLDEIATHSDINVLSSDKRAGPDERGAVELGENLLQNFGAQIDGIFCPNESTASGMLTALRRHPGQLAGNVKFVGFDGSPSLIDGLKQGHLHGTVLQDPVEMGYRSVASMRAHLLGQPVESRIPTRVHVAKSDALDDPVSIELLGTGN